MRKLFILTAIVGLIGAGGYAPEASASSVSLELTSPPGPIAPGGTATWNIVMTIDGTGGGDGQVSNTSVLLHVSNAAAAVITAGVSAPTASGVGLTNFNIRNAVFAPLGTCVNTATTGTCTAAVGLGATDAGYYGGLSSGAATFGTFTVGSVTVTSIGIGGTQIILFNRPGIDEWTDGFGNVLPTQPTLGTALVTVIPEPATASLLGLGLVGVALRRRERGFRAMIESHPEIGGSR